MSGTVASGPVTSGPVSGRPARPLPGEGRTFLRLPSLRRLLALLLFVCSPALAAPVLQITPLTWNVIGLDSNRVTDGPNIYPVGARVCNVGDAAATNLTASFVRDGAFVQPYLNLQGPATYSVASLASGPAPPSSSSLSATPGNCFDFYFNVVVTRDANAYSRLGATPQVRNTQPYRITATATGLGTVQTPPGRELYVEKLVSQGRNSVTSFTGPAAVAVGGTYEYTLTAATSTLYEQLESFAYFPTNQFQIIRTRASYTSPGGAVNSSVYADACGWINDPTSVDYHNNGSCNAADGYTGGKVGNGLTTVYTIKVLGPGNGSTANVIYDYSGSSYHYNSDYGTGGILNITSAYPPDLTLTKTHSGTFLAGQNGTYTLTVSNSGAANTGSATGTLTVTDPLPAGMTYVSATGSGWTCGASGGVVTCTSGAALAAGASAPPVTLTVRPSAGGTVTNTASVAFAPSSGNVEELNTGNNSAPDPTTVNVVTDLAVTKTDFTGAVLPGQTVTYTIRAVNNGPNAASGAVLTDNVPALLGNVTWTCSASAGAGCAAASGTGSVSTALNLPSGGAATLTVKGTLSPGASGTLSNTASVAAPAGVTDSNTANDAATDTDTVTPSFCAARGGTRGTNLLWSGGTFGTVPAGSSTTPPTVRNLGSVATGSGIRTDYAFVNRAQVAAPANYSPEDGEYNLSNSTGYRQDGAWYVVPDHTSGDATGQMLVVNAGTNLGVFYQQTVNVTPNTTYELSAWIINLIAGNAATLPNLSVQLDRAGFDDDNNPATADGAEGQVVYASGDLPNTSAATWRYLGYLFHSGGSSQVTVRFRNSNPGGGGNDLALDDLSFTPCTGLPVGNVSGTLYRDRNSSGSFDAGGPDSRLGANIAVSLTDANNGVTVTLSTDANGNYSFVNVPAGTYRLWVATVDPDLGGLTARTPTGAQYTGVTLGAGASLTGQNFGFNAAGLVLTKRVRNCGAVPPGVACPAAASFGTAGAGRPGEALEYCIDYSNPGSLAAANVVLTDLVPGNTTVDLNAYGSGKGLRQTLGGTVTLLTSAADTDGGELSAAQLTLRAGSLAAGASGQVCFRSVIR